MTTTTRPPPLARPGGAIMPGVLRSEWTKLSSLRSTRWILLITVVVAIAVSAIVTSAYASQGAAP